MWLVYVCEWRGTKKFRKFSTSNKSFFLLIHALDSNTPKLCNLIGHNPRKMSKWGVLVSYSAVTNYHKCSGLNNKNLLFYNSGGQKSKIKLLAGLFSFWRIQGISNSLSFPTSRSCPHSLACGPTSHCLSFPLFPSSHHLLCLLTICFHLIRTLVITLGPPG